VLQGKEGESGTQAPVLKALEGGRG
jgi:hypothetical protein